jgi:uncharacterized membrane protein
MKKKLITIFWVLLMGLSVTNYAQEVFVDTSSQNTYLFVGSLRADSLKLLTKDNKLVWLKKDVLQQSQRLTSKKFVQTIFANKLIFSAESEEPFWSAEISEKEIVISSGNKIKMRFKISIVSNDADIDNSFHFMFQDKGAKIFGMVRSLGLHAKEQRNCELCMCEENSIFEVFIQFGGQTLKGCATIQKREKAQMVNHK